MEWCTRVRQHLCAGSEGQAVRHGNVEWVRHLVTVVVAILSITRASANDSTAELATGGLVFTKNDSIELQAEDLFISTKEIRVRYHFINKSRNDIITQVAFPMPDIHFENADGDVAIPTTDPQNILGFTTTVDNRPVAASVEQKAFAAGVDRSELLRRLGVPIGADTTALDRLPRQTWDELARHGLAGIDEYQVGTRTERHLKPRWTLKTTFFWQQTFPAKQTVVIDHRYSPSVGGTVPLEAASLMGVLKEHPQYCADAEFMNALNTKRSWEQRFLEYILTTGANWSGPIKDFRLVVDKGSPANLVSFCAHGVRRISPTQFEMHVSNFCTDLKLIRSYFGSV
jgi:hypothetical protein